MAAPRRTNAASWHRRLATRIRAEPNGPAAVAMMTVGLILVIAATLLAVFAL